MTYEEIYSLYLKTDLNMIDFLAENHDKIFYVNHRVKTLKPIAHGIIKGITDIATDVSDLEDVPSYMQDYYDISLDKMEYAVSDSVVDYANSFAELIEKANFDFGDKSELYCARDIFFDFYFGEITYDKAKEDRIFKQVRNILPFIEENVDGKLTIFLS